MEGESLFNDGVAVVAFSLLVGLPLGTEEFAISTTFARFCTFVGIGVGIGCLVGFGISFLTQRFDLPLVEQSFTLVSAYGTYLMTENLGGSGSNWSSYRWLDFGEFWLQNWYEPSYPADCLRVLGLSGIFCQLYCVPTYW